MAQSQRWDPECILGPRTKAWKLESSNSFKPQLQFHWPKNEKFGYINFRRLWSSRCRFNQSQEVGLVYLFSLFLITAVDFVLQGRFSSVDPANRCKGSAGRGEARTGRWSSVGGGCDGAETSVGPAVGWKSPLTLPRLLDWSVSENKSVSPFQCPDS